MKKAMFSALLSTAGILCLVLLLLWFVGDARFVPSLGNPRLWVAAGILFLSVCGLFLYSVLHFCGSIPVCLWFYRWSGLLHLLGLTGICICLRVIT